MRYSLGGIRLILKFIDISWENLGHGDKVGMMNRIIILEVGKLCLVLSFFKCPTHLFRGLFKRPIF